MKKIIILSALIVFAFAGIFTTYVKLTDEGGVAIKLINRSGSTSVKGNIVMISSAGTNSFCLASNTRPCGVVYESGIGTNTNCWIVVNGIAQVLVQTNQVLTNGFFLYVTPAGLVTGQATRNTLNNDTNYIGYAMNTNLLSVGYLLENVDTTTTNVNGIMTNKYARALLNIW